MASLATVSLTVYNQESSAPKTVFASTTGLSVRSDTPVDYIAMFTAPDAYEQLEYSEHEGLVFIGAGGKNAYSTKTIDQITDVMTKSDISNYNFGFVMYDMTTGLGIAYNSDQPFYSASSIKGLYTASLVSEQPESLDRDYQNIEQTLKYSSNESYEVLVNRYGVTQLRNYFAQSNANLDENNPMYPFISARDLAKVWIHNWEFFNSGMPEAKKLSELYSDPNRSPIAEQLGSLYTTYSKAGWYDGASYQAYRSSASDSASGSASGSSSGSGSGSNSSSDANQSTTFTLAEHSAVVAGIVIAGDHPYLISVMTDAPGVLSCIDPLVLALNNAHNELASLGIVDLVKLQHATD
jgi:hypothetical protein